RGYDRARWFCWIGAVAGWVALSRGILQFVRRQFLSQPPHGSGRARLGPAKFYDFYERTHIFYGAGNLPRRDITLALRDLPAHPNRAPSPVFHRIEGRSSGGEFR